MGLDPREVVERTRAKSKGKAKNPPFPPKKSKKALVEEAQAIPRRKGISIGEPRPDASRVRSPPILRKPSSTLEKRRRTEGEREKLVAHAAPPPKAVPLLLEGSSSAASVVVLGGSVPPKESEIPRSASVTLGPEASEGGPAGFLRFVESMMVGPLWSVRDPTGVRILDRLFHMLVVKLESSAVELEKSAREAKASADSLEAEVDLLKREVEDHHQGIDIDLLDLYGLDSAQNLRETVKEMV